MYSLAAICAMNDKVHEAACQKGKKPYVYDNPADELYAAESFPFPSIGNYEPPGWTPLDIWFVDSTGGGKPSEPALTTSQFITTLLEFLDDHPGDTIGFAVVDVGQFQVHVQAFQKESQACTC